MIPLIERLCAVYTHFNESFTSATLLSEALTINNPGIIKPLFVRVSLLQTTCEALTINNPGIIKPLGVRVSLSEQR